MYHKEILSNGMTLIEAPLEETQTVTVLILFKVGSRYEPSPLSGASHFIEHLMFKGTTKRKNTLALSRELDAFGAEYNAFTAKDYTGYYVKIHHGELELALDILSDMLLHSLFDEEEMRKERKVIVEEVKMYRENPIMYLEEFFESLMYGGSSLGWEIGGSAKTVLSMPRDQVLAYKAQYYQPANAVICIAGRFDADIHGLVEQYFVQDFPSAEQKIPRFRRFSGTAYTRPRIRVDLRKVEQAQVGVGFPAYSYFDKRLPALRLLSTILGGNMSSRLFIQVRERRGLAYFISSQVTVYEDTGNLLIHAGLDGSRLQEALKTIGNELVRIREKGVTSKELQRACDHMQGKLTLNMEDSSNRAQWFAKQQLLTGKVNTFEENARELRAVTVADVQAVAKDVLKKNLAIAIIGDVEDTDHLLKQIAW